VAQTPEAANEQRDRLIGALRAYGAVYSEAGRVLGTTVGLHTTDANAIVEILAAQERDSPLTQTQLSHRIGLTGGATSSLLNRLEDAGHVRRARDNADRRIVTLHSTEGVEAMVDQFLGPLGERMGAVMSHYPPEKLHEFERFLEDVTKTMNEFLEATGHVTSS
jgi:DNA-binding MarR family transcriptional regulator